MTNDATSPGLDQLIGHNLRQLREREGRSQDDVAHRLRAIGLPWSRSTVAALEQGAKTVDVAEFVLLTLALLEPPATFLQADGWVELRPGARITASALASLFGDAEVWGQHVAMADLDVPESRQARAYDHPVEPDWDAVAEEGQRRYARYDRIIPRATTAQLLAAHSAAEGEAERKAARKLGVEDPVELALAAISVWGRSLTEERDARVADVAPAEASPRSRQALRGHITRQLLDELEPILRMD